MQDDPQSRRGTEPVAFTPGDYAGSLQKLAASKLPHFLVGGQAVNAWAEFFHEGTRSLQRFLPYTSKDCDLWVAKETLDRIAQILDGRLIRAKDPADVQVGVFFPRCHPTRGIDLLGHIHGIRLSEMPAVCGRPLQLNGMLVMDPIYLFKAKCHNLVELSQARRNDEKHLLMLRDILPAFFTFLIRECHAGELNERTLLKNIKLLRDLSKDPITKRGLARLGFKNDDLLPISALQHSGLLRVEHFANSEWPG